MITLAVLQRILIIVDTVVANFTILNNGLSDLYTYIHNLTYPSDLIQIFGIVKIFLPTTTIVTLFTITAIFTSFALLTGLVHALLHLGNTI